MNTSLQIRGNADEFVQSSFIILPILYFLFMGLAYLSRGNLDMGLEILGFFIVVWLFIFLSIKLQTIKVDNQELIYSSNFFPLIPRRINIMNVKRIGFGKNFAPIADPTSFSKINMSLTDEPIVGLRIYNAKGKILGGFNTKVYSGTDLEIIIKKIIEINPQVTTDFL